MIWLSALALSGEMSTVGSQFSEDRTVSLMWAKAPAASCGREEEEVKQDVRAPSTFSIRDLCHGLLWGGEHIMIIFAEC